MEIGLFADDPAIVAGLARFNGRGVAVIGHQKGRDTTSQTDSKFWHAETGRLQESSSCSQTC